MTCACSTCNPPPPSGLVHCDACNEIVAPRGDHYSVHYHGVASKPCPRSWPGSKPKEQR